jgi:hypothetical protein
MLIIGINNILKFTIWRCILWLLSIYALRIMKCWIDHVFTLKDSKNMVESNTNTNGIVSFGFLDELKY